jgi:hypothetical protein
VLQHLKRKLQYRATDRPMTAGGMSFVMGRQEGMAVPFGYLPSHQSWVSTVAEETGASLGFAVTEGAAAAV